MLAHTCLSISLVALLLPQPSTSDVWRDLWNVPPSWTTPAPAPASTLRGAAAGSGATRDLWGGWSPQAAAKTTAWWPQQTKQTPSAPAGVPITTGAGTGTSVWTKSVAEEVSTSNPILADEDVSIWNPFTDLHAATGTCAHDAELQVDKVIDDFQQCEDDAEGVSAQANYLQECTGDANHLWESQNYLCCYASQGARPLYWRFRVGVLFFRLFSLFDNRPYQDLPAHPNNKHNEALVQDVSQLPTEARLTLNHYCTNECAGAGVGEEECDAYFDTSTATHSPTKSPTTDPTTYPTHSPTKSPTTDPTTTYPPPSSRRLVSFDERLEELQKQRRLLKAAGFDDVAGQAFCFHRDTTALLVTGTGTEKITERRMDELKAGDRVLVMDETTGELSVDRVSINLHLRDARKDYEGVTLHYSSGKAEVGDSVSDVRGELSLTPNHVLVANGRAVPAARVKVGDVMTVVTHPVSSSSSSHPLSVPVRVTRVGAWTGGIINPLTHTGRILAGASGLVEQDDKKLSRSSFALATSVLESPHQVQFTLVSMPSVLKAASFLFPVQFQQSELVESAIMAVCGITCTLQGAIVWLVGISGVTARISTIVMLVLESIAFTASVLLFLSVDICVGITFLAFHVCGECSSGGVTQGVVAGVATIGLFGSGTSALRSWATEAQIYIGYCIDI